MGFPFIAQENFTADEAARMADALRVADSLSESPPEPFRKGGRTLVKTTERFECVETEIVSCWRVSIPGNTFTPKEAEQMAGALYEHAAWARKQGERNERQSDAQ